MTRPWSCRNRVHDSWKGRHENWRFPQAGAAVENPIPLSSVLHDWRDTVSTSFENASERHSLKQPPASRRLSPRAGGFSTGIIPPCYCDCCLKKYRKQNGETVPPMWTTPAFTPLAEAP